MNLKGSKKVKLKDGSSVTLRSPIESDAKAYIDFAKDIFATSQYVITQSDEFEADVEKQIKYIKDLSNKENNIAIVAEVDGKIVGNIDFRSNSERRRISHRGEFGMSVTPPWQGKGLGEALIQELISWTKQSDNGVEKIELKVAEKNTRALNLYKKMGFQKEGKILKELKISENEYLDTL